MAVAYIRNILSVELQEQGRQIFLWSPVFLAFGIGLYFSLPLEPPIVFGVVLAISCFIPLLFVREEWRPLAVLPFLVALGFVSAQIRSHVVYTPILQGQLGPVNVVGTIEAIESMGDEAGTRLTLGELEIERLSPEQTPVRIRLRLRKDPGLMVGQRMTALAGLNMPSPPVIPGGFDFQRYLYFQRIGAVGFIFKDVNVIAEPAHAGLLRGVERARSIITQETETHMHYPQAGIAMALMNGRKTAIAPSDAEAMRASGLAHLLAISGLHIGLFSGVLFFFARLCMAAVPALALRRPIKKYAALIGIAGAFAYMLLAGATVPTQRAFLMTSIVFIAILFDRSPISLRLVAFAAFAVLLFFPESLLSASFHMSFAAVTALIVFYSWLRPVWSGWYRQAGIMRRAGLYFAGISLTTLVAGFATGPFALFHFQQMAVYSLLANILAMPVMAFIVMPAIVLTFVLMPLHLDFIGYLILERGVKMILDIAHWVTDLPHAVLLLPSWPLSALICMVLGMIVLFLVRRRALGWSIAGVLFAVCIFNIFVYKQPDILISSNFKLVGMRMEDGRFLVSNTRGEGFARESWVRHFGMEEGSETKWPREYEEIEGNPFICDERACRMSLKNYKISYIKDQSVQAEECAEADIVLSQIPLKGCAAKVVVDRRDTKYEGSHALWLLQNDVKVSASEDLRGERLWSGLNSKTR